VMTGMTGLHTVKKCGRRPPMSHFKKTWKTAAVISEYRTPIVALLTSQKLRIRSWQKRNTTKGTKKAINAAAQIGIYKVC